MNKESRGRSKIFNQPKAAAVMISALTAATLLLGACGGGSEPTATPVPPPPTLVATATTSAVEAATPSTATENGVLTQTEQAASTTGITEGSLPSGTANVSVITSTQLVTGTEVVTNVQVSTNTAVIEQQLITTVITNTNLISNVVQSTNSSNTTQSTIMTATAQLTPQSSAGQAVANVTITPLPPTETPAVVVSNTLVLTPQPTETSQASEGQTLTGTAPVAAGAIFTGVTDAQGKAILGSTLLGSKFLTSDGQISGKLDDLVVDMQSSQLLYLLLQYGGVLDVGETTVAVPLNALSLKEDGTFLLNIPPADLKNFPSLADDWPQAGSPNWDSDVRAFWQKEGFNVGFDPSVSGNRIRRIDSWIGAPLNDVGLGAGTVQDQIISLDQGSVPYVLVSFANAPAVTNAGANAPAATATPLLKGGTAVTSTAGDNNWYAVPLPAFDAQNPQLALRSDVNASTFEGAPRFNRDSLGENPFLPSNYDKDWQVFWKKLTTSQP